LKFTGKTSAVSPTEITIVEETKRSLVIKNDEYYIKCGFLIPRFINGEFLSKI
jgi:hypothetical protein